MSNPKPKLSRRQFMTLTGLGGAATAAAVLQQALPADAARNVAPAADRREGRGYELTEHIRNYYRTTQV